MTGSAAVPFRRQASRSFLFAYRSWLRLRAKVFSLLASGSFASFGEHSVIQPPVRLLGEERIAIGRGVFVGAGSWLQVLSEAPGIAITVGDGTSIAGTCTLSAARSITVGVDVLIARGVYVADHSHALSDLDVPIRHQGIDRVAEVAIGDGAWLGQNVVIGPGVRVGRGAVIGANAVVLDDVPDFAVAVGVPARVVRTRGAQRVEVR